MKSKTYKINRRELLAWSAPVITSIAIPAHAVTSGCPPPPVLNVLSNPKCAGSPPIGQAVIEILAPVDCELEIVSFSFTSDDPNSELNSLPTLPALVDDMNGITFSWIGPAGDAITCLPLAQINAVIEYSCTDGSTLLESFDITKLLVDSIQ